MELHERLRAALPNCAFGPPASGEQIRRVERELDLTIPTEIRQLYLHFDGLKCEEAGEMYLLRIGGESADSEADSPLLKWNLFCRTSDQDEGGDPLRDVLQFGFLDSDRYIGVNCRTGELVLVWRRGNEVHPAGTDLCDLLIEEYEESRRFGELLDEHVFGGRVSYFPAPMGSPGKRDIDRIVTVILNVHRGQFFQKDLTDPPDAAGGTWVLSVGFEPRWEQIRLRSDTGNCPFVIESDVGRTSVVAETAERASDFVLAELDRYWTSWKEKNLNQGESGI